MSDSLTKLPEGVLESMLDYLSIIDRVRIRRVCTVLNTIVSHTGLSPIPLDQLGRSRGQQQPPIENIIHSPVGQFTGGVFSMVKAGRHSRRRWLCLSMPPSSSRNVDHAWTTASLKLPPKYCNASSSISIGTRRWTAVFLRTRMSFLRPNGGYCSIQQDETSTVSYEIKFDGNKLRGYGPCCTDSDFGISVPTVRRLEWLQLLIELVPCWLEEEDTTTTIGNDENNVIGADDNMSNLDEPSSPSQGLRMSIDGVPIKTIKLRPPGIYTGICDIIFRGYRSDGDINRFIQGGAQQWWDSPIWVIGPRPDG